MNLRPESWTAIFRPDIFLHRELPSRLWAARDRVSRSLVGFEPPCDLREPIMRRLIATLALCAGGCAVPAFADPAMTTAPVVMRRAAPSPKARIVQSIPANARIDLSHCSRDWCYASWRDGSAMSGPPRSPRRLTSGAPGVLRSRLLRAPGSRRALVGLGSTRLLRLWMGPSLVATAEPHVHPRHGVSSVGVSGPLPSIHEKRLATTRSAIARRVWREAEPTWGSATTLSSSSSACDTLGSFS